jgi:hypothetical protein
MDVPIHRNRHDLGNLGGGGDGFCVGGEKIDKMVDLGLGAVAEVHG